MIRDPNGSWRTTTSAECQHWLGRADVAVRPPTAQVPAHLVGHPSGDVFARLVRMNDGPRHAVLKAVIADAFGAVSPDAVARAADAAAAWLVCDAVGDDADVAHAWIAGFAPLAIGALCGIDIIVGGAELIASARALAAFGPAGTSSHTAAADRAVATLGRLLDDAAGERRLRWAVDAGGPSADHDADRRANEIGWFFQSFDACSALLGSVLAARLPVLARSGQRAAGNQDLDVEAVIAAVLADAPPIHTTRRYPIGPIDAGPVSIDAGDTVFVSLDPVDGPSHPFGWGAHRCPAERLAPLLARHALTRLEARLDAPHRLRVPVWRPSPTARIPMFKAAP